ncbi:MAG: DNA topoisomerase IV subunit A [Phycisphaeraceae bacterium]|nr:DNA topoisomerase IV subunit A [Phycisphaeraceae bacterium]
MLFAEPGDTPPGSASGTPAPGKGNKRGGSASGGGGNGGNGGGGFSGGGSQLPGAGGLPGVTLREAAQQRYLNYALSVITSRALPDVRDGLKPVQRRILFAMGQERLTAEAKHRKCAKVVGDVMGSYHPHGDMAIYEALVRLAQAFAMRHPLIDGSGNFGSLDGDSAAAMRYTECRLTAIAGEMLKEISQETVAFRPNYDGTKSEPVVLPARLPNLLVNGSTGIAVGMATNIPPHNLGEVCKALLRLADNAELTTGQLCTTIKGPDFPTGGQIVSTAEELREIYKTGSGAVKLRGTWEPGPMARATKAIYITSIPYTVNKSQLVEAIAEVVLSRKMPLLTDVRDLSTEDVRIELELKREADEQKVLAYLYKHTPLQTNFNVNLTCLVPTENPEAGRPERCDLRGILQHFLHFRLEVVTRRLGHELEELKRRIHILEGFAAVFDALDEIIKIIRKSEGKADAAGKIMQRFKLDEEQVDAILELKLYRLARLEILVIQEELKERQKRAREIKRLLSEESAEGRWAMVKGEIKEIAEQYAQPRRTVIQSAQEEPEFDADDFIIAEDNVVIVSRDGWVKRQKEVKDLSTQRLREGDAILTAQAGSTRATMVFMSNFGVAYTARIIDMPATTGYGEPIQKFFKLRDGEKLVAAFSLDPRALGDVGSQDPQKPAPTHAIAATSDGYGLRFNLDAFVEPSTRAGRRYARPAEGAQVVGVETIRSGQEIVIVVSQQARASLFKAKEVNFLTGPGKGVLLMKLSDDDRLLGMKVSMGDRDLMTVETSRGAEQTVSTAKYEITSRGGRGRELLKRGELLRIVPEEPAPPVLLEE